MDEQHVENEDLFSWRVKKLEEGVSQLQATVEPLKPMPILLSRLENTVDRIESKLDKNEQKQMDKADRQEDMAMAKQNLRLGYNSLAQYKVLSLVSMGISILSIFISHFVKW